MREAAPRVQSVRAPTLCLAVDLVLAAALPDHGSAERRAYASAGLADDADVGRRCGGEVACERT